MAKFRLWLQQNREAYRELHAELLSVDPEFFYLTVSAVAERMERERSARAAWATFQDAAMQYLVETGQQGAVDTMAHVIRVHREGAV